MGTAKENIGAAQGRCAAGQKERAGRVRPEMYESAPLGKFKSVDALLQAYNSLQAEFTRRSRRLRELEGKLAENAAAAPAGGDEETAPVEKDLGAAGQAENAFAPAAGTGGTAAPAGGETPAEDAPAEEAGKQAAARESACRQCGADMASAARDAGMAGLEQGEAAVSGGAARHAAGAQGGPESGEGGGARRAARGRVDALSDAGRFGVCRRAAPPHRFHRRGGQARPRHDGARQPLSFTGKRQPLSFAGKRQPPSFAGGKCFRRGRTLFAGGKYFRNGGKRLRRGRTPFLGSGRHGKGRQEARVPFQHKKIKKRGETEW